MGMMAAVKRDGREKPCIVYWTGREGLSVRVITYCEEKVKVADDGVIQIPDVEEVCNACNARLQKVYEHALAKRAAPTSE